ncbi:hypothetical protein SAMN04488060_1785 [Qipengyuania nanhaisediminis]|uniref:Uncharacterized protein n=1 Tax=Qipengyuania nanhaisediminis TaxID=604088 RepID=A0A1I5N4Q5_9SPHN|nr:hypothetical protein SAMN04488060_1785 [Qipengyuania nanhaisediminis]
MNMMTLNRLLEGEPLCPPATHRTRSRLGSLIRASGLAGGDSSGLDERISSGYFTDPSAGIALLATSCNRPLYYPEGEAFAVITQMDLVLLRFDPLEGVSFDLLLNGSRFWLCNYLAWRRSGEALWLVPSHSAGAFFRLSSGGLEAYDTAPYANGYQRFAGIIRGIETPLFEGSY